MYIIQRRSFFYVFCFWQFRLFPIYIYGQTSAIDAGTGINNTLLKNYKSRQMANWWATKRINDKNKMCLDVHSNTHSHIPNRYRFWNKKLKNVHSFSIKMVELRILFSDRKIDFFSFSENSSILFVAVYKRFPFSIIYWLWLIWCASTCSYFMKLHVNCPLLYYLLTGNCYTCNCLNKLIFFLNFPQRVGVFI